MTILFIILIAIVGFIFLFMRQRKFGKLATGERLERMQALPYFQNNAFQNLNETPALAEGETYSKVLKKYFTADKSRTKPGQKLVSVKTNLFSIDPKENILVWFGHSSYYMQVEGKKILVDPVLSGSASPIPGGTKAFSGADIYKPSDIPDIDYLFLTHDHWDHLDYKTILALKPRIKKIICAIGVGAHLEHWGFQKDMFIETAWYETNSPEENVNIHTIPARHFSGRSFKRNKSLWVSFVLETQKHKIYIGGDSGYDSHFAEAGKRFGPFDLAILENGQYNQSWKYIHMMPEEVIQAAADLQATTLLPVHSSKFNLSLHDWDEPLQTITSLAVPPGLRIITPCIGEIVYIDNHRQQFKKWWLETA